MRFVSVLICLMLTVFNMTAVADDAAPIVGQFRLEQKSDELWVACYELTEAVDSINFDRRAWAYQKEAWHFNDPDLQLIYIEADHGTQAVLTRVSGRKIKHLSIEVTPYLPMPEKEYYAFSGFTGGGMSIYVGYFMGSGVVDNGERRLKLSAAYVPLDGNAIITRDNSNLVSQFVYYGPTLIQEDAYASLVVDPAIPSIISDRIKHSIPLVNDALANIFSFKPQSKYQVFIAGAGLTKGDGYSSKGGTQESQILFTYKGKGVLEYERKHPEHMPIFVAHEVIHLWQTDLWPRLGDEHPWMHEGMADALAIDLMAKTGTISRDIYKKERDIRRTKCLSALRETSVDKGPNVGRFDIVYNCGAIVHWTIADAMHRKSADLTIFEIWKNMAAQSVEKREQDGKVLYYQVLKSMGFDEGEIASLDQFLASKSNEPEKLLMNLEKSLGL